MQQIDLKNMMCFLAILTPGERFIIAVLAEADSLPVSISVLEANTEILVVTMNYFLERRRE